MRRHCALSLTVFALSVGSAFPAVAPAAPVTSAVPHASVLCRPTDPRIDEASGIAAGLRSPGVFYVQNDSGDSARFFAISTRTCTTAAVITVPGASNVDWEDIAVARSASGVPSVWLADTGDNDAHRSEVRIYRVDEPAVRAGGRDASIRAGGVQEWRLRYPTGPVDAESLAVAPGGTAYVVTKSLVGASTVYRVPDRPSRDRVQVLQRIGAIHFTPTGTADPFGVPGELTATSAAISPDGTLLAVRTYADAYLWRLRRAGSTPDVVAALRAAPARTALPDQPQGEGIAFWRGGLVLDSEGVGSAVYRLTSPALPRRVAASGSSAGTGSSAGSTTAPATDGSSSSSRHKNRVSGGGFVTAGVILGLLVIFSIVFWRAQRGNRR